MRTGGLSAPEQRAQVDELAGLYAEHTDVRHPFAPMGAAPLRTRSELRRHFERVAQPPYVERYEAVGHVYETADPEVVVFEFSYAGSANGRPVEVQCIFVTRVRDGVIVESRDYVDHVGSARAFGRLANLATALAADGETS